MSNKRKSIFQQARESADEARNSKDYLEIKKKRMEKNAPCSLCGEPSGTNSKCAKCMTPEESSTSQSNTSQSNDDFSTWVINHKVVSYMILFFPLFIISQIIFGNIATRWFVAFYVLFIPGWFFFIKLSLLLFKKLYSLIFKR